MDKEIAVREFGAIAYREMGEKLRSERKDTSDASILAALRRSVKTSASPSPTTSSSFSFSRSTPTPTPTPTASSSFSAAAAAHTLNVSHRTSDTSSFVSSLHSASVEVHTQNFLVNDRRGKLLFGFGHFRPTLSYMSLEMCRSVILADFSSENVTFRFLEDNTFNGQIQLIQLTHIAEKISRFGIIPSGKCIICVDTPEQTYRGRSTWHQDEINTICISDTRLGEKIRSLGFVDYTLIEYTNDCVSTTLKHPLIDGDIIRFQACPGTVLCADNKQQEHSSPYVTEISRHVVGDEMISTAEQLQEQRGVKNRQLIRMTITKMSDAFFGELLSYPSIRVKPILTLTRQQMMSVFKPAFTTVSVDEYVELHQKHESGGKRKHKRKKRKSINKRRNKKRGISRKSFF